MSAEEEQATSEEPVIVEASPNLEKKLEKQINLFSKFWAMLDSPVEQERSNALTLLHGCMEKINTLTEQITGESGDLNFSELLNKIQNSGEGGNPEELEEMELLLEQYEAANEALKSAEDFLSRDNKRLQFLLKSQQYESADIQNPDEVIQRVLGIKDEVEALVTEIRGLLVTPNEEWDKSYNNVTAALMNERYDLELGKYSGVSKGFIAWAIRKLQLPGDFEDLLEMQCLLKAHVDAAERTEKIRDRVEVLEGVANEFSRAIEAAQWQTCMNDETREMLGAVREEVEENVAFEDAKRELAETQEREENLRKEVKAEQKEVKSRDKIIKTLEKHVARLREALKIEDPLASDHFPSELDPKNPKDLREICEAHATQAFKSAHSKDPEEMAKEIALLREQVALLSEQAADPNVPATKGDNKDKRKKPKRFELVERKYWIKVLKEHSTLAGLRDEEAAKAAELQERVNEAEEAAKKAEETLEERVEELRQEIETQGAAEVREAKEELKLEKAKVEAEKGQIDQIKIQYSRDIRDQAAKTSNIMLGVGLAGGFGFASLGYVLSEETPPPPEPAPIVQEQPAEQPAAEREMPVVTQPHLTMP